MDRLSMNKQLDMHLLNREGAQQLEEKMIESLLEHQSSHPEELRLKTFANYIARNVTVPIAVALKYGDQDDIETRMSVENMIIRGIALAFTHYMQENVKGEHIKEVSVEFAAMFMTALLQSTKMMQEEREKNGLTGRLRDIFAKVKQEVEAQRKAKQDGGEG